MREDASYNHMLTEHYSVCAQRARAFCAVCTRSFRVWPAAVGGGRNDISLLIYPSSRSFLGVLPPAGFFLALNLFVTFLSFFLGPGP